MYLWFVKCISHWKMLDLRFSRRGQFRLASTGLCCRVVLLMLKNIFHISYLNEIYVLWHVPMFPIMNNFSHQAKCLVFTELQPLKLNSWEENTEIHLEGLLIKRIHHTRTNNLTFFFYKTSGSHAGEYEDECLLGCCAVLSGRSLPTFQRCLLPLSLGLITLMEAASISETLVNFYQATRRNNPQDSHILTYIWQICQT
jgi:hypothetical protein